MPAFSAVLTLEVTCLKKEGKRPNPLLPLQYSKRGRKGATGVITDNRLQSWFMVYVTLLDLFVFHVLGGGLLQSVLLMSKA